MKQKPFEYVKGRKPNRSLFDLSHAKGFDCRSGELIPVCAIDCVPGDTHKIGYDTVVRLTPTVAPIYADMSVRTDYFFVPYRLLWDDWEDFISGNDLDDSTSDDGLVIPKWANIGNTAKYSLWDYCGFPVDATFNNDDTCQPVAFPQRAYVEIYNNWYRDENLQTEVAVGNTLILNCNWEKDYFTSALPFQQKGVAPAVPIAGATSAEWSNTTIAQTTIGASHDSLNFLNTGNNATAYVNSTQAETNAESFFNANTVNLDDATGPSVSEIRLSFAIQRWMELNARAGTRYTEYIQAHFGTSPKDERLQRPEWVGGARQSIVVSEIVQTSETGTSPQGTLAGHGLSADSHHIGSYYCEEHGILMGIMRIQPRITYHAQGIDRNWIKNTKFDYFSPEFANIAEQGIYNAELYQQDDSLDSEIFGYQGRWNEMRTQNDKMVGSFRDTLDYWHLGRKFSSLPTLNSTFVTQENDNNIFQTDSPADRNYIVYHKNNIISARPLPAVSDPGYIDH